jgi:hypothetical protein
MSSMDKLMPRTTDRLMQRVLIPGTHSGRPPHGREALHQAGEGLRERGDYPGMVRRSVYTQASMHPLFTSVAALGAGLLVAGLLRKRDRYSSVPERNMAAIEK